MSKNPAGDAHPDDLTPGEEAGALDAIEDLAHHKPPKNFGGEEDDDDEDDAGADAADEDADEPDDEKEDDDDLDDDDDDDEDEDDEDDEDADDADADADAADDPADAAPVVRKDGAEWNTTAARWQKDGKFVEGDPPPALAGKEKGASTADAGWAPFSVTVDREPVPIADVAVSKANGYTIYAVPDAKASDFNRRIGRGVAAERYWRQITDDRRQLEDERKALAEKPPVRSDSEVEADILLEVLKPHLQTLFDETEVENITMRVKLGQADEQKKLGEWQKGRETAREAEEKDKTAVANELGDMVAGIIAAADGTLLPEYAHLDDAAQAELMQRMAKYGKTLVQKNAEGKYDRQHELAEFVVTQFAAAKKGSATTPAPKKDATPAKPGTTAADKGKKGDRAEKFNKGVDTAARPKSTNLKDRRTRGKGRPASRRTTGEPRGRKGDRRTREQREEDKFRRLTRSYAASPTLDMGGGDDD